MVDLPSVQANEGDLPLSKMDRLAGRSPRITVATLRAIEGTNAELTVRMDQARCATGSSLLDDGKQITLSGGEKQRLQGISS